MKLKAAAVVAKENSPLICSADARSCNQIFSPVDELVPRSGGVKPSGQIGRLNIKTLASKVSWTSTCSDIVPLAHRCSFPWG